MLLLVQIDLLAADLPSFEAYETTVLTLLGDYGARLEARVRSKDGRSEVHLLAFPDVAAFEAFRADPARAAAQGLWEQCGATSKIDEVERIT